MSLETRDHKFFLNGKEIRLISGTMHYFRVVPEYWRDRMLKMKACGLNCLETYVCWNLHEEVRGEFNFEGILDVRKFIQIAHEVGLYVLFRPGPYICAEWDFGGLPSWLLHDPDMMVRSSYKPYLDAVDAFFTKLLPYVVDLQFRYHMGNSTREDIDQHSTGGPIIAFQIENEYGSYGNDTEYKMFLKKKFEDSGLKELYFTSDNGVGIQIGEVPGALITANFQESEHGFLMKEYLDNMKQPGMPFMAMEFWTGWFDHWGEKHHVWPKESFEKVLRWILSQGGSVNFYMFHGGTNFGFMAGANEGLGATNEGNKQPYQADITSYDYDAPIAENGALSEKWYTIRNLLKELVPQHVSFSDAPSTPPGQNYGRLDVSSYLTMEELLHFVEPVKSEKVVPMEMLDINKGGGQSYGMTLYRKNITEGSRLKFPGQVHDRAVVYIDHKEQEVVDYLKFNHEMALTVSMGGSDLDILVENMGRVNYAEFNSPVLNDQRKGLRDLHVDGKPLSDWTIYPLEFKKQFLDNAIASTSWHSGTPPSSQPSLCKATLAVEGSPGDTFINMKGWTKGLVFVNGFNLGRYWDWGPQETLYIPGPLLRQGENQILIFELHKASDHVTFDATPTLGETVNHTTEISGAQKAQIFFLRNAVKLGKWVWKPIRLFMK